MNALGILARSRGELDTASRNLEDCLAILRAAPYPELETAALNNLALVKAKSDAPSEAEGFFKSALQISQRIGDRHHEAAILNNLADLLHRSGQEEDSMDYLKQAVRLFSEIGGDTDRHQPDIWMLTSW